MARLGDICSINMGQSPDSSTYNEEHIGLPFFQGNADFGALYPSVRIWCSEPVKIAKKNDILISVRAPIGALNIADTECCIGRGLAALTVNLAVCEQKYLWYGLESKIKELNEKGTGSTFKAISKNILYETEILLPPIDEQVQIADTLDKVSNLIALRKQQLDKLDKLVKARFVEMFGDLGNPLCQWEKKKMVDVCVYADDIKCGPFGTQLNKDEYQVEGIAVWEIPQINSNFKTSPTHFLTAEKANQLSAYSIEPGDIAMSRKGNVGRCALFPDGFEPGIIHSDVLRIRVDSQIVLPRFMMCQLHYSAAIQHQIDVVSSGAIMAGINVTKLKEIHVHIPPLNLQAEFNTFMSKMDKCKLTIQQGLDKLEMMKKALMQEYFG